MRFVRTAQRGGDLVKQILTFSRRTDTKFESINLNEDVTNAERLLYRTIPKMIEIKLKLEEKLKPVRADSTQIEQLLINLSVNANDAMPEGGQLTIETQNVILDEDYCRSHAETYAWPVCPAQSFRHRPRYGTGSPTAYLRALFHH